MLTSRISSGFDIELQLGGGWFLTAVNLLNDHGLLAAGVPVIISNVQITFEPEWDLQIDVLGFPVPILARAELSNDGSQLTITTNLAQVPPISIPFGVLRNLAGPPQLVKLAGDDDHEAVLAVLANMNIRAGSQSEEPLPDGEHVPRGDTTAAQSFLPRGQHIAFGMGRTTLTTARTTERRRISSRTTISRACRNSQKRRDRSRSAEGSLAANAASKNQDAVSNPCRVGRNLFRQSKGGMG